MFKKLFFKLLKYFLNFVVGLFKNLFLTFKLPLKLCGHGGLCMMMMLCEDVWQVFGKTLEGFVQSPPAIAGHAAAQTFSEKYKSQRFF